jgi:DNA-binding beta-propeller fold protein YncE
MERACSSPYATAAPTTVECGRLHAVQAARSRSQTKCWIAARRKNHTAKKNNNGFYDVEGIAVAPNGERVYAASQNGGGGAGGALTVFSRNAATQAITQLRCVPRTLATKSGLCQARRWAAEMIGDAA